MRQQPDQRSRRTRSRGDGVNDRAAPLGDGDADQRRQPRGSPRGGKAAPGAEIVRRQDRIDAAEPQERRQMQAADHAAGDEEGERRSACAPSRRRRCRACRSRSRWRAACRCRTRRRRRSSDGPIGAMAPPKPGTSAATGTIAAAAMAMSRRPPRNPSAWPRTIRRRHEAVKLNSVLRNAAPSAKPNDQKRRGRRLAVDKNERDEHGERQHRSDQERPVETRRARRDERMSAAELIQFSARVF